MATIKRLLACLLPIALLLTVAVGCSSQSAPQENGSAEWSTEMHQPFGEDGVPLEADTVYSVAATDSSDAGSPLATPYDNLEQKLISTAALSVETLDFEASLTALTLLTDELGGFVQSSGLHGNAVYAENGDSQGLADRYADYELRIPSDRFDSFLSRSGEIGNVISSRTETQNISTQFYDTQSRLDAWQLQYDRLLTLLERAEAVEDLIRLEQRLTEVRADIESMTTQLRGWQNQVTYSTVNLSLREVGRYTPMPQRSFIARLGSSFFDSFDRFTDFLGNSLIALIYLWPSLLLISILIIPGRKILRLLKEKRDTRHTPSDATPKDQNPLS